MTQREINENVRKVAKAFALYDAVYGDAMGPDQESFLEEARAAFDILHEHGIF